MSTAQAQLLKISINLLIQLKQTLTQNYANKFNENQLI